MCFGAKYPSLDTFWSPSVDWTKTLSGVYLREFCSDLRDSFSDCCCLPLPACIHSHHTPPTRSHSPCSLTFSALPQRAHTSHTHIHRHSLLSHSVLTRTAFTPHLRQTFDPTMSCCSALRVSVSLCCFLIKLLLTGPKRCQVMSLTAAMTETSPKMLLKTADQYLVWKSRVSDACWAATHRDPFAVE